MAAAAVCCRANTACLQRQRCINSHAQTQRTVAAWSTNKLGPAACAAGCFQSLAPQRWGTARTAPWGTCPCGCRTTTACVTACEWKKNELLHHSLCNAVALLLCVLVRALQHLSGAPFTVAGVELRCVSQNPNQNAPHPFPIQRHALFSTQPTPLHAIRNNRARFFHFLCIVPNCLRFDCVYLFCTTTHAPSTQSSHIILATISTTSLAMGAIIAHRLNLRIPIMHTMASRQCFSR